jgi:hypothetical protein
LQRLTLTRRHSAVGLSPPSRGEAQILAGGVVVVSDASSPCVGD